MFRFGAPIYLWLFAVLPLLVAVYIYLNIRKRKAVERMGVLSTLKQMMPELSLQRSHLKFWLIFTALCFGIVMLARPQFGTKVEKVEKEGIEMVIAIDVSNSMMAKDVSPSRLARAKQILTRLIDVRKNDKIGLIVFAGEAFVQMPMTTDSQSAKLFLNSIDPSLVPVQGTAIAQALSLGINSFSSDKKVGKAIVVITDGEDHEGNAMQIAEKAAEAGIMVNIIGIGSLEGSPIPAVEYGNNYMTDNDGNVVLSKLNETMCMEIAQAGKGMYIQADNSNSAIRALENEMDKLETTNSSSLNYSEYDEKFAWFAWIVLIILIIEVCLTERKSPLFKRINLFK